MTLNEDHAHEKIWSRVDVSGSDSLLVSNPNVQVPKGIWFQESFLSENEEREILDEIRHLEFSWEGFEERRKVQRYELRHQVPECLRQLQMKIENATNRNLQATHVAIEEYEVGIRRQIQPGDYRAHLELSTFESTAEPTDDSCFVACCPVGKAALHLLNKPKRREVTCWGLESPNHWTKLHLNRGSLLLKTDECLRKWRCQTRASDESPESVFLIKYYCLPRHAADVANDKFGYIPGENEADNDLDGPLPPLEDLLTIVITTSPIKSNPSTELLERAMETFRYGGDDFAIRCRKVIVCDGVRNSESNSQVSSKHSSIKQAMRNGIVTTKQQENYEVYKQRLRELCKEADQTSVFHNAIVEELDERQGYGFALRHSLRHLVATRFVCVIQHDRTFMRPTPINETVEAMYRHPNVKYVGMSMRSNLTYRDIFICKFGAAYHEIFRKLILRLPELEVDSSSYGPNSDSADKLVYLWPKLRKNVQSVADSYQCSIHQSIEKEWSKGANLAPDRHQMSLTPTLFWYDNVHICETKHYRDFIFDPVYKMVAKGGFVEDKLSPVIKRTVDRLGLAEGHSRFGCYLLDDHSGLFFTGHLDGGSFVTGEEKKRISGGHHASQR